MGILDSNSSSSLSVSQKNIAGSGGSLVANEGGSIQVTDEGAIKGALDLTAKTSGIAFDFGGRSLDFAQAVNAQAINALSDSFSKNVGAISANTTQLVDKVTLDSGQRVQSVVGYILLAVSAVAIFVILR